MMLIVAADIVASRLPEGQPTGKPRRPLVRVCVDLGEYFGVPAPSD